jgi:hypothetical protein
MYRGDYDCAGLCGADGSIFEAVHFLETEALSGHVFQMDAVPQMAQMRVQGR